MNIFLEILKVAIAGVIGIPIGLTLSTIIMPRRVFAFSIRLKDVEEKSRVKQLTKEIVQVAKIKQEIVIKSYYHWLPLSELIFGGPNASAGFINKETPAIFFNENLFTNLSDEELKAIIAHEIGHLYHKHTLPGVGRKRRNDYKEAEADAFAIEIAGKDYLISAFEKMDISEKEIFERIDMASKIKKLCF